MIRHIVLFRLSATDPEIKRANALALKERIEALEGRIDGLLSVTIGLDLGYIGTHWDVGLVSEHADYAALEAYQAHPEHTPILEFANSIASEKAAVDYSVV